MNTPNQINHENDLVNVRKTIKPHRRRQKWSASIRRRTPPLRRWPATKKSGRSAHRTTIGVGSSKGFGGKTAALHQIQPVKQKRGSRWRRTTEERERRVRGGSTATASTKRHKEEEGGGFPRRETFAIALESIACMVV
ncbi:hypothetical protein GW17_00011816 [Ensete ventricosum]|nr:hypothetical protein GW17_00011816 [Ensete ventricosum]RZR83974.1 hypothetical protein BHM03_00010700 [Ensete ventricosum]